MPARPVLRLALPAAIAFCALAAAVGATAAVRSLHGSFTTTISGKQAALDGRWTLTLLPDARHYVVLRNGHVAARGIGTRTATRVTFGHEVGLYSCPDSLGIGVYRWRLAGKRLTLSSVTDACVGRRTVLGSHPLLRR